MSPNDDSVAEEMVRAIREMTERLVVFRQEIQRAVQPLYPRITAIEEQNRLDRKERIERQKELDDRLTSFAQAIDRLRNDAAERLRIQQFIAAAVVIAAIAFVLARVL